MAMLVLGWAPTLGGESPKEHPFPPPPETGYKLCKLPKLQAVFSPAIWAMFIKRLIFMDFPQAENRHKSC
jgi:hypothetical protein